MLNLLQLGIVYILNKKLEMSDSQFDSSWLSFEGWANRREGMYKVETKKRKFTICLLFLASAIFCTVIGIVHTQRLVNASSINLAFEK